MAGVAVPPLRVDGLQPVPDCDLRTSSGSAISAEGPYVDVVHVVQAAIVNFDLPLQPGVEVRDCSVSVVLEPQRPAGPNRPIIRYRNRSWNAVVSICGICRSLARGGKSRLLTFVIGGRVTQHASKERQETDQDQGPRDQ